jgi:DNA-binding response OmpR family regulator
METLHTPIKTLVEKKQTSEISKILLIDKNSAFSTALAHEGYDVVHCDSVQKAWNLVYPRRPHLIILNVYNSNGAALADVQECRALAEGVPIVLVNTSHISRALLETLEHGAGIVVVSTPESVKKAIYDLKASMIKR